MSLLLAALVLQVAAPQLPPALRPPAPHVPSYSITQQGLEPPTFDGGRTEFECADVNADGHVDIVSVGDHGSPHVNTDQHGVMVWRGDGQKGWSLVMTGEFGYGGVAIGDVDGDGHADAAWGVHHNYSGVDLGDQLIEVARGDGSGAAWTPWDDGLATTSETWGMFGTDLGDVDGDGDLDVGSNSFGCCSGLRVYRNNADGTWTSTFVGGGSNSDMDFVFCDFNGDGHLDVAAANSLGVAWRGDGTGAFADAGLDFGSSLGVSAGDVDGDGADELVTIAIVAGDGTPWIWRWGPGDTWTKLPDVSGPGDYDLSQLCDLDADGDLDLAAVGGGTLSIWRNLGPASPGEFGPPTSLALPGAGSKYGEAFEASSDLDHNGYPDMLVLQDESSLFGGGHNELYALYERSKPTHAWIRPLAPEAGRVWRGGQARFVTWACAVPDPAAGAGVVMLELSTSGPFGPWTTLASAVPNNGRRQLVVPSGISSSACTLRASVLLPGGATASATSPAPFTLLP